jgi:hypothetical protein
MTYPSWIRKKKPYIDYDSMVYSSAFLGQEGYGEEAVAGDVSHALYACKMGVRKLLEGVFDASETGYEMYLGGSGNFRNEVATIKPYKSGRPPKPIYYNEVREYLHNRWNAQFVDGMEAEDKASIEFLKDPENSVLVHIDKDLDQVPGWHYNWKRDEVYHVSPEKANWNFWMQVLTGDYTDSIVGIPGVGPKKAAEILSGLGADYDRGRYLVEKAYKESMGDSGTFYRVQSRAKGSKEFEYREGGPRGIERVDGTFANWSDALAENGKLIYILRTEDEARAVIKTKEVDDGKDADAS